MAHDFGPRTRLIHGNQGFDHGEFRSHAFPIFQTSTFKFDSVEDGKQIFSGISKHDAYSRISNPNHRQLEDRLCILEEGEAAQVFDSGMSAIKVALMSFIRSRSHIVAHNNLYGGTCGLLKELGNFGVETTFVDAKDASNVIHALTPETKIVFLETPSNPMLDICDFEEIKHFLRIMERNDIIIMIDNTFATPCNQKPLTRGADIVIHSLTKYICGSGKYIGGAIVTSQELMRVVWERHSGSGGMMDPETAANITINVMSIYDRVQRHNDNASKIALWLKNKQSVAKVYYPGLFNHPNHDVAARLMSGFGGMISFRLAGADNSKTATFLNQLANDERNGEGIITLSVSLGSVDTLICCPALSTHLKILPEERLAQGITDDLIRLSVGTEDVEDIIYSLERGFQIIA